MDKNKGIQIIQRNQRPMSLVFLEKQNTLLLSQTYNLFFAVLCTGDEVNGFHVSKVDIPSEDVHVQQLAHIFLFVVSTQASV